MGGERVNCKDFSFCRSCAYCSRDYTEGASRATCDYLLITGHPRSLKCRVGKGCVCYLRRQDRKKFDREEARRLYDEGRNDSEIGRILGVSPTSIRVWRLRTKLPSKFQKTKKC